MKTEKKTLDNGDLQIVLTFDAHDQRCLEHDLLDILDWYESGPSREKVHACQKRMINQFKDQVLKLPEFQSMTVADSEKILNNPVAICKKIASLPTYKNRRQRDAQDSAI